MAIHVCSHCGKKLQEGQARLVHFEVLSKMLGRLETWLEAPGQLGCTLFRVEKKSFLWFGLRYLLTDGGSYQ